MLQKVKPKIYDKKQKSIFLLSFPKYESKNDEILVGVLWRHDASLIRFIAHFKG